MARERKVTFTDKGLAGEKPDPSKRRTIADPAMPGHYLRIAPSGVRSFVAVARDPRGRQVWATTGQLGIMTVAESRERARAAARRIRAGLPPFETPDAAPETFRDVAAEWLKRHVDARGLRTAAEIRRVLARYIAPELGELPFTSVRRGHISRMLDKIEDGSGARQADVALGVVRSVCNWYATRHDDYHSPVIRGMKRDVGTKRSRVLSDDEIGALWGACSGPFGAFVKLALVTGQRRGKLLTMRWSDLREGVWHVPTAPREKGTGGELPLPDMALRILDDLPHINDFVLAGRAAGPMNGMSKAKKSLDDKAGVSSWVIHDLRRTSRSLMSRAGVSSEHAERVLGHVIGGIEGTYNRHRYTAEKGAALRALAGLLETILHPPAENVVPLRENRA